MNRTVHTLSGADSPGDDRGLPAIVHETGDEVRVTVIDAVTIGREEGDIRVPSDPYLSHRHARIERSGQRFFVRDCGSTNGTFVQMRHPMELRPGDEILIGSQLFRVVM